MSFTSGKRTILLLILLLALSGWASKGEEVRIGDVVLKYDPQIPRVTPRLSQLYQGIPADSQVKIWVFLTDKQIFSEGDYFKAIEECKSGASPRALRRMELRSESKGFDFTDIPLPEEYVERIEAMELKVKTQSKWLNAVSLYANEKQVQELSLLPFVKSIDKVARYKRIEPQVSGVCLPKHYAVPQGTSLDYGNSYPQLAQINVPALHNLGYNGSGVLVCMMDGGFQKDHPAFARAFAEGRIFAEYDFINNDSNTQNQPGDPSNQDVHGTYTWSALGGEAEGELYGPAYKADFILAKTEDVSAEYQGEEDNWVRGAEWADSIGADIISSSVGYLDWYTYSDMDGNTAITTIAADLAAQKGILVVNSAGNERQLAWHYMIAPADGDSVLAVGAVDINGEIAPFSSAGPTYDGRLKPDIVACGVEVYCANPNGGYDRVNGTSLSAPLAAGAAALLLQIQPTWSPMEVINSLRTYASRSSNPDTLYGWGVIDVLLSARYTQVIPRSNLVARPNPFTEWVIIFIEVDSSDNPEISIHTAAGEVVARDFRLARVSYRDENGYTIKYGCETLWNGQNQSGEEVADGIYLINVRIGDNSQILKVAKVSK